MNQKQINRLEMLQATNDHLDSNPEVWTAIPVIGTYKNQLVQLIDQIKSEALKQDAAQVFVGKSQRDLKKQIADKMDIADDILEAYAADTNDPELLSRTANSYSDYFKLGNEDFEIKVKNVIDIAEAHLDVTVDYGANAAQLDDIKADLNLFLARRGKPRAYQIASKTATLNLEDLFKEVTVVLKKMDNVINRFKRSNTTFYNGYNAARIIVDK